MTKLTPEDVARRREKATPGPWELDGIAIANLDAYPRDVCLVGEPLQYPGDLGRMLDNHEANAAFIAAAHDMADLIERQARVMDRMAMDLTWIKNHTYADQGVIRDIAENALTAYHEARGKQT